MTRVKDPCLVSIRGTGTIVALDGNAVAAFRRLELGHLLDRSLAAFLLIPLRILCS